MEHVFHLFLLLTRHKAPGVDTLKRDMPSEQAMSPDLSPAGRTAADRGHAGSPGGVDRGTFWGQDDHFPFGPFRMYSVANRTDGAIRAVAVEATTQSGATLEVDFEKTGLRRAEVEGLLDLFVEDPSLLRYVFATYEQSEGGDDPLVEVRLVERTNYLRDGKTHRTDEGTARGMVEVVSSEGRAVKRSPVSRLGDWWFSPLPRGRVAALRTILYLFIFVDVLLTTSWVANHGAVPGELYEPVFIGRLLSLPTPGPLFVPIVQVGLLLCAALAATGRWPRLDGHRGLPSLLRVDGHRDVLRQGRSRSLCVPRGTRGVSDRGSRRAGVTRTR